MGTGRVSGATGRGGRTIGSASGIEQREVWKKSPVSQRAFSVKKYHRMAGILGEDDRVELIEGELTEMSPIGSPYAACVNRISWLLYKFAGT